MLAGSRDGLHVALSLIKEDKGSWLEAHIQDILGARHIGQPSRDVVGQIITACRSMPQFHVCLILGGRRQPRAIMSSGKTLTTSSRG